MIIGCGRCVVADAVNAVGGNSRLWADIKKKHSNLKNTAKSIEAHNKKEMKKTGRGKANFIAHNDVTDLAASMIPVTSIIGIAGGIEKCGGKYKTQR